MGGGHRHLFDDDDGGDDDEEEEENEEENDVYMYPADMNPDERVDYRAACRASEASG